MSTFNSPTFIASKLPFIVNGQDDLMGGVYEDVGGLVKHWKAQVALNLGDVVHMYTTALTVTKSATVADHDMIMGVVVGGARTFFECVSRKADYVAGIQAAAAGEEVIVMYMGFVYVAFDAAVSAIGDILLPSTTTAGRVKSGTTANLQVGRLVGSASSGVAGDVQLIHVNV